MPQTEKTDVTSRAFDPDVLLEEALRAMSEEDQALLVPYFMYDFSQREIGDALGMRYERVRDRVRDALNRTRKKLGVKL